jgi:hypothetical protein
MKFYRSVWIDEKGFPVELYKKIVALKKECQKGDHFHLECQPGDEQFVGLAEHIVALCIEAGLAQTPQGITGTYGYDVMRHYEADDLGVASFLMLETQTRMFRERLNRDESGRLILPAKEAGTTIKFSSGMFNHFYVVPDSVKTNLEAGQLTGLFFRETVLKGSSIRATTEMLWEIESKIKLPKMVNSGLNPHSVVPCYWIAEPPYRNAEPHYRQGDLLPLGRFDVARTFEQLGSDPGMIISQRFYQYCLQHKISLRCRPVRIDSE